MSQALPLTSLGRYKIVAELGRGAMGTVYHGLDATIERPVALKTLNPELPGHVLTEVKQRFLREARSAGQLNHPNIVTIYEFGEDAGTAFIAMEFLSGKSLQDVMAAERLPFATIADIMAQIADALDYAHRFGVIHRDVKPANIMLSPHRLAKLTDFGIARVQSSSMTQTGATLGSPKYMSPEQVLGQQVDGRADIFSLGVVLYEMLAAKTPFETPDMTMFSLMQRIVTVPQPAIVSVAPDTPAAFDVILAKALAKKPEKRYQRASELANDLRSFKTLVPSTDQTTLLAGNARGAPVSGFAQTVVNSLTQAGAPAVSSRPAALDMPGDSKPRAAIAASNLLGDLNSLGADIDDLQRRVAEEEAAAIAASRKAGQRRDIWPGMEIPVPPVLAPLQDLASNFASTAPVPATPRSSVFDLMRPKEGAAVKQDANAKLAADATAMVAFDAKLRAGYQFLSEFFRELNGVGLHYAGTHTLPYFGDFPPLHFSEGAISARTRSIEHEGKARDVLDHLPGSYFLISNDKRRVTVNADELLPTKKALVDYDLPHEVTELRDDFGKVRRANIEVTFKIVCSFKLRADYPGQVVDLTCRNIGALGRRRYSIPIASLEISVLEEFTRMLLGYPAPALDAFAA